MALIPDETISEIRERVDVVAVIGEHVQLKKAGINHKGLCPFHHEKTPSFHVNPAKRSFYCFGCHKGGDVFAFLMELEGKSFIEVVRQLAPRVGVTLPERPPTPEERARQGERGRLHDANAVAAAYFRETLLGPRGAAGRSYLASRGIGEAVAVAFQLGLASEAWDGLVHCFEQKKVPLDSAVTVGLVAPRGGGRGHYDRFRHRLMCPVLMPAGEVAGFSGRTLGGDPEAPKYLNSPESPVYKKSHLLYGLHAARAAFRTRGRAVLVEGNFDVIALHQAGFGETVAPLGTALTEHQVEVLRRLAPRVVLCLDGDAAGRAAALRAIPLLVAAGLDARVAALPTGADPDSFVREQGAAALGEKLDHAQPSIEYFLDEIWFRTERSLEQRAAALHEAAPLLASLSDPVKKEMVIGQFALALGVEPRVVRLAIARPPGQPEPAREAPSRSPRPIPLHPTQLKVIAILADHPELMEEAEQLGVRSLLTDERLRDMYSAAQAGRRFLETIPKELGDVVARELMAGSYSALAHPGRTLNEVIRILKSEKLEDDFELLGRQIREAEKRGENSLAKQLWVRRIQTRNEADELKRRPPIAANPEAEPRGE